MSEWRVGRRAHEGGRHRGESERGEGKREGKHEWHTGSQAFHTKNVQKELSGHLLDSQRMLKKPSF